MGRLSTLFLILIALSSCEPNNVVFNQTTALDGHWGDAEVLEFKLPQLDSLKKYNLFVNVRNTNDYEFNNLFMIVTMEFPHGKTIADTLEYRMANPDGSWLGYGIGNIKENKLWYKEDVRFFEEGSYTVRIGQAMRNNGSVEGVKKLEGITDVGFTVEESTQQ